MLKQYLLSELTSGQLSEGAALPTEVELAESMGVARNTVRQALSQLEQEGRVVRIRGKGTFVCNTDLEAGRSNGIKAFGLLLPYTQVAYYPSLQRGFCTTAQSTHNQVIVCGTDNNTYKQAESILQLLDKEVAGIAMVPTDGALTPAHHLRPFQSRGVPVVFCHRRVAGVRAPLVTFSALEVGRAAGCALRERGHRRVAYATSTTTGEMSAGYLTGLRDAMAMCGGEVSDRWTMRAPEPEAMAADAWAELMTGQITSLLELPDRPTAIFASFDTIAERLYLLLTRMGVRVPEDISLIGFGDASRNGAVIEELSSVTVDEAYLGTRASELLWEMCEGSRDLYDDERIVLPVGLSDGRSLGAPRAS